MKRGAEGEGEGKTQYWFVFLQSQRIHLASPPTTTLAGTPGLDEADTHDVKGVDPWLVALAVQPFVHLPSRHAEAWFHVLHTVYALISATMNDAWNRQNGDGISLSIGHQLMSQAYTSQKSQVITNAPSLNNEWKAKKRERCWETTQKGHTLCTVCSNSLNWLGSQGFDWQLPDPEAGVHHDETGRVWLPPHVEHSAGILSKRNLNIVSENAHYETLDPYLP